MRIPEFNIGVPANLATMTTALKRSIGPIITQLNNISGGIASAYNNTGTAAPTGTTTKYSVGDFVRNSAPSILGDSGSQYIINGWTCVTAGAPGTWVENRSLTGD